MYSIQDLRFVQSNVFVFRGQELKMLQFKNRKIIRREQLLEECQSLVFESRSSTVFKSSNSSLKPNFTETITNPIFQRLIPELSQIMLVQVAPKNSPDLEASNPYKWPEKIRPRNSLIRIHFLSVQEVERAIKHFHYSNPRSVKLSTSESWEKTEFSA